MADAVALLQVSADVLLRGGNPLHVEERQPSADAKLEHAEEEALREGSPLLSAGSPRPAGERNLLLVEGSPPAAAERLPHADANLLPAEESLEHADADLRPAEEPLQREDPPQREDPLQRE